MSVDLSSLRTDVPCKIGRTAKFDSSVEVGGFSVLNVNIVRRGGGGETAVTFWWCLCVTAATIL